MESFVNRLLACIACALFSPIMVCIAVAILISDGPPVFFRQQRLGINRTPFLVFKFRTMERGIITRSGRWLRATGLDELAQLLNIARGDMNVVGPRPLTEADMKKFEYDTPQHSARWSVKPGLTGISQIWGGYNVEHSWELDRRYLEKRSFLLDMKLVGITFLMNIGGKRFVRKYLLRGTYE